MYSNVDGDDEDVSLELDGWVIVNGPYKEFDKVSGRVTSVNSPRVLESPPMT